MNTDYRYTLIHYRPDSDEYLGCGDYERHHSQIGFESGLSFEQLQHRIFSLTKTRRYDGDDPCEFAILRDGQPIIARGETMWSFAPEDDTTEEAQALDALFYEANILSEKEKKERAEAKRKEEEEKARAYAARERDRRYFEAKALIEKYEREEKEKKTGGGN